MSESYEKKLFNAIKHGQKEPKSTYDIWKELGNEGGPEEFLESLKGDPGLDAKSNYDIWVELGNDGTPQDFLEYLKGTKVVNNVTILSSSWVADNEIFKATIIDKNITADNVVNVNFTAQSMPAVINNIISIYANSIDGGFEIYSASQPNEDLVINYAIIY